MNVGKLKIGAALKRDLHQAPHDEFGPMTAQRMAAALDKSAEWVWAVMRGEIQISLRDLLAWEEATSGIEGIRCLAAGLGLMVLPKPSAHSGNPTVHELTGTIVASAHYIEHMAEIYEDGVVDRSEATQRAEVIANCNKLIESAIALRERYLADAALTESGRTKTLADAERQAREN